MGIRTFVGQCVAALVVVTLLFACGVSNEPVNAESSVPSPSAPKVRLAIAAETQGQALQVDEGQSVSGAVGSAVSPSAVGTIGAQFTAVSPWHAPASHAAGVADHDVENDGFLPIAGQWHPGPATSPAPWPLGGVESLLANPDGALVAVGHFETIDGTAARRIARWHDGAWQPLGEGLNAAAEGLAWFQGQLIVGGYFAEPTLRITRWDGDAWQALGFGLAGPVRCLAVHQDQLIVGGDFPAGGGAPAHLAVWNGASWAGLGAAPNGPVYAACSWGDLLVVAGSFTSLGGIEVNNLAAWDGSTWHNVGGGVDLPIYQMTVWRGDLVVTGNLTAAGGVPVNRIARWDGQTWHPLGEGLGGDDQPYGRAVTVWRDLLIAGGNFTQAGTSSAQRVAAWNGQRWLPLATGLGNWVEGFAIFEGELLVGGWFNHAAQGGPLGLGRWRPDLPAAAFDREIRMEITAPVPVEWQLLDTPTGTVDNDGFGGVEALVEGPLTVRLEIAPADLQANQ